MKGQHCSAVEEQKRVAMRTVLILTQSHDPHLPPVAEAIRARGAEVLCFNLADFPEAVALSATLESRQDRWSGSIRVQGRCVPLETLASIWWRRPKQYKAPTTYSPGERAFLEEEANRGIIGVLESLALQQTLWVSHLHSIRRAELKPLQLAAAQQLGLRTPRTLLTNDSGAARAFYETCQGQVVLKAVSRGAIEEEERRFIAPRLIIARTPRACACSCGGGPAIEISVPPRRSVASELLKVSPPTPSSTRSIF